MFYTFVFSFCSFFFVDFFFFTKGKTQHMLISIQFPSRTTNCRSVVIQDMKGNNRRKQSQKTTSLMSVVCQGNVCTGLCTQQIHTGAS